MGDGVDKPFNVGKKIMINGKDIIIKNKAYKLFELQNFMGEKV